MISEEKKVEVGEKSKIDDFHFVCLPPHNLSPFNHGTNNQLDEILGGFKGFSELTFLMICFRKEQCLIFW